MKLVYWFSYFITWYTILNKYEIHICFCIDFCTFYFCLTLLIKSIFLISMVLCFALVLRTVDFHWYRILYIYVYIYIYKIKTSHTKHFKKLYKYIYILYIHTHTHTHTHTVYCIYIYVCVCCQSKKNKNWINYKLFLKWIVIHYILPSKRCWPWYGSVTHSIFSLLRDLFWPSSGLKV